jgi:mannose/cellobiose epimerase-like protein (N-acyl-D-glucosamine 2-epimerase family)
MNQELQSMDNVDNRILSSCLDAEITALHEYFATASGCPNAEVSVRGHCIVIHHKQECMPCMLKEQEHQRARELYVKAKQQVFG